MFVNKAMENLLNALPHKEPMKAPETCGRRKYINKITNKRSAAHEQTNKHTGKHESRAHEGTEKTPPTSPSGTRRCIKIKQYTWYTDKEPETICGIEFKRPAVASGH